MTGQIVVLVTCASKSEAERIARSLVEARLAACVNILRSPVRSIYRWKGSVESAQEHLLLIKTSRSLFRRLRAKVQQLHSYEVPEIIALSILEGSPAYLRWIAENVGAASPLQKQRTRPKSRRDT